MAWVAVDRAVRTVEEIGLDGPVDRWRALRDEIHEEVCAKGFNGEKGAFTQYYGSDALDASLLLVPLVGFLPATDERVRSRSRRSSASWCEDGLVLRYRAVEDTTSTGSGREGAFLACSFWLADCLHLLGRKDDAVELFERLLEPAERPGAHVRGVRHPGAAAGGELPAGVLPRVVGQHGLQPLGLSAVGVHGPRTKVRGRAPDPPVLGEGEEAVAPRRATHHRSRKHLGGPAT